MPAWWEWGGGINGKQGQLIGRELLALAIAPGIQQLAQQGLDFVAFGELAIQLCYQVQHHLL